MNFDTMEYIKKSILSLIAAVVISIIFGFISYNYLDLGNNALLTLFSFCCGLLALMYPKLSSNDLKAIIISFIFGLIFYFIFINVMPLVFGSSFALGQFFNGLISVLPKTISDYVYMILVYLFIFSILSFFNYQD